MTIDQPEDLLTRSLRRLPLLSSDEARSEQFRKHCRAAIGRTHLRRCGSTDVAGLSAVAIELAVAGLFCAGYLLAVAHEVLRLYGV